MTKDAVRKAIGTRIRNERLARSMSTDELAKLLSLSPGFIGLIESGRRGATVYNLLRLSNIFDIPVSAFFPDEKENKEYKAEKSIIGARRAKLSSLVSDLDETEMGHVISTVKEMKALLRYGQKKHNG